MTLPYQCVAAIGPGGIVAATRGTSIFTFASNGSLISSWEHPATQQRGPAGGDIKADAVGEAIERDENESPSKKRKIETDVGVQAVAAEQKDEPTPTPSEAKSKDQKHTRRGRNATRPSDLGASEQPYVNLLKTTSTGSHLVAVTGTDKAVWVFEHDGKGQLKELSQRCMPKRPCDLAVTSDDSTILVADKFGDVYSLPLIPTDNVEAAQPSKPIQSSLTERKGANNLTVHSQRNLKSLIDQERQRQLNPQPKTKMAPTFVHDLLIGHVSMLTSVAVATAEGKPYILTADRDEHIRVSRGIPQTYVIENFCLGHESFINALTLPQPDVLVSGGGDDELYVWDWRAGLLKEKVDLLSHVQQVSPTSSKVAVSQLVSSEDGWVLVACERVPAVFVFRLVNAKLSHVQTLKLAGNALDLAIVPAADSSPPRVVVGIDEVNASTSQLVVFQLNQETWESSSDPRYQQTDVSSLEISRAELNKILYTVEHLRKSDQPYGDGEGGDTVAPDSEAPSTPAE